MRLVISTRPHPRRYGVVCGTTLKCMMVAVIACPDMDAIDEGNLQILEKIPRTPVETTRFVEAQAEAKAIQIQVEAIRTKGGSEYVQLKTIEKWNGQLPQYTGGSVPLLNIR